MVETSFENQHIEYNLNCVFVSQVVEWISMLVDAHFAQLVLSIEARKLLVDLHQVVDSQVCLYTLVIKN